MTKEFFFFFWKIDGDIESCGNDISDSRTQDGRKFIEIVTKMFNINVGGFDIIQLINCIFSKS